MVLRQVIVGVSGGAALAAFALILTVPRQTMEASLPVGVLSWAKSSLRSSLFQPNPRPVQDPPEASLDARLPEQEPKSGVGVTALSGAETKLDVSGVRVASLFGAAVSDIEPAPEESKPSPSTEGQRPAQNPVDLDPDSFLGALSKQTIIRSEPDIDAPIIGFARTGALLRRAKVPASTQGCRNGWYRVEPDGYVCVGKTATLDLDHPILRLASYQPDRSLGMPYPYGKSRYPTPPLYTKIPTRGQQQIAEKDLQGHLSKNFGALWADQADTPPPSLLEDARKIPRPYGYPMLEHDFMTGRALVNSTFAFIDMFEADGRRWGLTADLSLLPLDRVVPVEESDFFGQVLKEGSSLPIAFETSRSQHYYELGDRGVLRPTKSIGYRQAFRLTGREREVFGTTFLETEQGGYIKRHDDLVVIEARESLPKWAKGDRSWLEISILNQTLVAYVGAEPVFATLVSTGKDGLGDPEETHSTILGTFLIHTKHVTSTMSGDAADDEFDLRDVPYVQYFYEGYALHAAFWHDSFGSPRSHGCVNLSPADARHLFSITEPAVPLRWHSALSRQGTLVYIHP